MRGINDQNFTRPMKLTHECLKEFILGPHLCLTCNTPARQMNGVKSKRRRGNKQKSNTRRTAVDCKHLLARLMRTRRVSFIHQNTPTEKKTAEKTQVRRRLSIDGREKVRSSGRGCAPTAVMKTSLKRSSLDRPHCASSLSSLGNVEDAAPRILLEHTFTHSHACLKAHTTGLAAMAPAQIIHRKLTSKIPVNRLERGSAIVAISPTRRD